MPPLNAEQMKWLTQVLKIDPAAINGTGVSVPISQAGALLSMLGGEDGSPSGGPAGGPQADVENPSFRREGPLVQVPVRPDGSPARVLEINAGAQDTDLGLPPDPVTGDLVDPSLINLQRTDINVRPGVSYLNANDPIPEGMKNTFDTVISNNPHGYTPDAGNVSDALQPGGRMIVQGRMPANRHFSGLMDEITPAGRPANPPSGMRVVPEMLDGAENGIPFRPGGLTDRSGRLLAEGEASPPADTEPMGLDADPADIMGGGFRRTTGEPTAKGPNARLILEKNMDAGQQVTASNSGDEGAGAPSPDEQVAIDPNLEEEPPRLGGGAEAEPSTIPDGYPDGMSAKPSGSSGSVDPRLMEEPPQPAHASIPDGAPSGMPQQGEGIGFGRQQVRNPDSLYAEDPTLGFGHEPGSPPSSEAPTDPIPRIGVGREQVRNPDSPYAEDPTLGFGQEPESPPSSEAPTDPIPRIGFGREQVRNPDSPYAEDPTLGFGQQPEADPITLRSPTGPVDEGTVSTNNEPTTTEPSPVGDVEGEAGAGGGIGGGLLGGGIAAGMAAYDDVAKVKSGQMSVGQAAADVGGRGLTAGGLTVAGDAVAAKLVGSAGAEVAAATGGADAVAGVAGGVEAGAANLAGAALKGGVIGGVVAGGMAAYDDIGKVRSGQMTAGNATVDVTAKAAVGVGAGLAGAAAGAEIGAAVGTAIPIPIVGTVVGLVAGAVVGGAVGYVGNALMNTDTGKAIMSAAGSAVDGAIDGVEAAGHAVAGAASSVVGGAEDLAGAAADGVGAAAGAVASGVEDAGAAVASGVSAAAGAVSDVAGAAEDAVAGAASSVASAASGLLGSLASAVTGDDN